VAWLDGAALGRAQHSTGLREFFLAKEHRGLITDVHDLVFLAKLEVEAEDNASRTDSRLRLVGSQFDWRPDPGEALEVGAMNAVAEPGPALVPMAAMEEPGVEAAEGARRHHEFGAGNVARVDLACSLLRGEGEGALGIEDRLHGSRFGVDVCEFVDQEGRFAVEKRVQEMLEPLRRNDAGTSMDERRSVGIVHGLIFPRPLGDSRGRKLSLQGQLLGALCAQIGNFRWRAVNISFRYIYMKYKSLSISSMAPALLLPLLWSFLACHTDALVRPLALRSAAPKEAALSTSDLASHAKTQFREALYAARYDDLPEVRRLLTAAYLEQPNDAETALLLAHSHLWTLSERARVSEAPDPAITDHALLADHYFSESIALAPEDERIPGWRGGVRLALGSIHQDERTTREGYFELRSAARAYPEFNDFSAAFVLGSQPRSSKRFAEAIELIRDNIEVCVGEGFLDEGVDYAPILAQATDAGRKRVCWNTPLVPHNLEGFFLVTGDLLTKAGEVEEARRAYEVAKTSPDYGSWRYASVLEARLADLEPRAVAFARATTPEEEPEMMFGSEYACTGCHAR